MNIRKKLILSSWSPRTCSQAAYIIIIIIIIIIMIIIIIIININISSRNGLFKEVS